MKNIIYKVFDYFRIGNIYSQLFLNNPHCVILAYHRVRPLGENDLLRDLTVTPSEFDWQIGYLKKDYEIIPLSSLENFLEQPNNKRKKAAAITFDDGYEDNYTYAAPIIKKYNVPATIFVPTAFIDSKKAFWWEELALILQKTNLANLEFKHNERKYAFKIKIKNKHKTFEEVASLLKYLNETERNKLLKLISDLLEVKLSDFYSSILDWKQMKEMLNYNISFGVHTHNHCRLAGLNEVNLTKELRLPKLLLEKELGKKIEDFAYPYGEKGDFDKKAAEELIRLGYKRALTMVQGAVFSESNAFYLNRIGVGGRDTKESFKLKLSGLIPLTKNKLP